MLRELADQLGLASRLADDGVPSASIAFYAEDEFSGATPQHVETHVISHKPGAYDDQTVYQAASISKAITALALAKLVEGGKVSYETKVVDHVPRSVWGAVVDEKTQHLMQYVTAGHLISHTAGLSVHGFGGYVADPPPVEAIFAGRSPSNTPRMKFVSFPGSEFRYSGGGTTLLQVLLEHVLGTPFAELMRVVVLQPLGMTRSRFGALEPSEKNYARAHLTAYELSLDPAATKGYHVFSELAAAGLWTTPRDLLRAVAAVQTSLHGEGGFVKTATAQRMLSPPEAAAAAVDHPHLSMTMGWAADATFFAHSGGNDPGYMCYAFGSRAVDGPVGRMGCAVMTDSALGLETWRQIVTALFARKNWPLLERLPLFGGVRDIVPFALPERASEADWKPFVGKWTRGFEVIEQDGQPWVRKEGVDEAMRLLPGAMPRNRAEGVEEGRTVFVVDGLSTAMAFVRGTSGDEDRIELVQCRTVVIWKRLEHVDEEKEARRKAIERSL